jgi:Chalcone isomerase-like
MNRRPRRSLPVLALAALLFLAADATRAAEIAGVQFAPRYRVDTKTLELNCVGLMRYMSFVKAYVAALYLGDGVHPEDALSDVPKRLEISYFYAINARDFAKTTSAQVAVNVDSETLPALRSRIDRLNALYEDVEPGDRYSLTYVPGIGTELALNGQPKGTIEGTDFARAVFAIWLGPAPLDASLKSQLLYCS